MQEYVWNKGARCESVITEFQVMCIAIGASAVMLLLLFMIVVCFAKQLHVLKTENNKLRKRRSDSTPAGAAMSGTMTHTHRRGEGEGCGEQRQGLMLVLPPCVVCTGEWFD